MGKLTSLLFIATALFAQTAGQITGEVRDPSGAIVPDAAITATNTATNVARSTVTNKEGIYSFPELAPGLYSVKCESSGFAPVIG